MSYHLYKGTVKACKGKGEGRIVGNDADVSSVIPTGRDGCDVLQALVDKYGPDIVAGLAFSAWIIEIQKAGRPALDGDNPDPVKSAEAILARANSDLAPSQRTGTPKIKITAEGAREVLKDAGIKESRLDAAVAAILKKYSG
jgi:hypothetical protein